MARYCEDYPCCGHNDGLGCGWKAPNYSDPAVAAAHHIGCDHEAGYCLYEEEDDDDLYEVDEDIDYDDQELEFEEDDNEDEGM